MLGNKAPCNGVSLELYTPFHFQSMKYLVLSFFFFIVLNVG